MKTFSELNTFSEQNFDLTDGRPANVLFSATKASPVVSEFDDGNLTVTIGNGIDIIEIINYSTADVRYVVTVKSSTSTPMTTSSIAWASLPAGVTVVESPADTYTVSGITSVADWDAVKNPIWTLPADFASAYTYFYVEARIRYYDQEADTTVSQTWDVYDINYYPVSFLNSEFIGVFDATKNVVTAAALTVSAGTLELSTRIRFAASLMSSLGTIFIETMPIIGFEISMNASFTQVSDLGRIRINSASGSAAFTISAELGIKKFNAAQLLGRFGPMGPGFVSYLEGNGFPVDTGLGFWPAGFPGIVRLTPLASTMQCSSTVSCDAVCLPFIVPPVNYPVTAAISAAPDYLQGIILDLPVSADLTANYRVDYDSNLGNLPAGSAMSIQPIKSVSLQSSLSAAGALTATADPKPMVLVYNTSITGNRTISLPLRAPLNVTVVWGDGLQNTYTTGGTKTHTYATNGTYTVQIFGSLHGFGQNPITTQSDYRYIFDGNVFVSNIEALTQCVTFGDSEIVNLVGAFRGATNLTTCPKTLLPTTTDIAAMFSQCTSFNDSNITNWNTSNVVSMGGLFGRARSFNQSIGSWNTSNVINMEFMFFNQSLVLPGIFNQNLNSWDTSKVKYMNGMFVFCTSYNQPMDQWNTAACIDMEQMFEGAQSFNQAIPRSGDLWNTALVTSMNSMFRSASVFDQDISNWCVPLIPSKPTAFDSFTTTAWTTAEKPVWGTCP